MVNLVNTKPAPCACAGGWWQVIDLMRPNESGPELYYTCTVIGVGNQINKSTDPGDGGA